MASKKPRRPNQQEMAAAAAAAKLSVADCFRGAEEAVEDVLKAAVDLRSATTLAQVRYGFRQVVGTGRTATWSLQHLKYKVSDVASWTALWSAASAELNTDPVSGWLYTVRNVVVKDGQHGLKQGLFAEEMRVGYMTVPWSPEAPEPDAPAAEVLAYMKSAPPMTPGCRVVQYPFAKASVISRFYVEGAPREIRGRDLGDVAEHYGGVLGRTIERVRSAFPGAAPSEQ